MGIRSLNNPAASFDDIFAKTGLDAVTPASSGSGLTASGGIVNDYEEGGFIYRALVFTGSGTFSVSQIGSFPTAVEYLVVAGGGGGGNDGGGGGGAGGVASNHPGMPSLEVQNLQYRHHREIIQ